VIGELCNWSYEGPAQPAPTDAKTGVLPCSNISVYAGDKPAITLQMQDAEKSLFAGLGAIGVIVIGFWQRVNIFQQQVLVFQAM